MPRSSTKLSAPVATPVSWPDVLQQAQQHFGIKRFRPGQREVLESVFQGKDTLALMPTGAGKSLTYQLPALFLPKPVLVISPLIALMQDQQEKAAHAEVVVEKFDSTIRRSEARQAKQDIAEGKAQLIYVTPERFCSDDFQAELKAAGGISLLVVDEAHTIPQWGHDFRPALLCIGDTRKTLGNPPVLALTATATDEVTHDILTSLHAEDATIINTGVERQNLFFSVHATVNNQAKLARILHMLKQEKGTGIIYTASVRSANELFELLTEEGISVGHYHGQMPARERERVQHEFMRGDHKVMIATKAFGLGIDKPNIRFVYHFEFPDSLETYYQEAGRAGRDGRPAHAVLLYRLEDKRIQNFFLSGRYPHAGEVCKVFTAVAQTDLATVKAVADAAGVGCRRTQVILKLLSEAKMVKRGNGGYKVSAAEAPTDEALEKLVDCYVERGTRDKGRLAEMMHYAETPNCRTQVIRAYFDSPEGEPCLRCDNCAIRFPDQVGANFKARLGIRDTRPLPHGHDLPHGVTTVHTTYGEIHTTAPETLLPAAPAPAFRKGDRVRHSRFGQGSVLDCYNGMVLVDFVKNGSKRLRADFLEAA